MINFAFSSTQVDNSIMDTVKIWNSTPSRQQADEIADALRRGEIVILPTDSVYAITCDALNPKAIASLCRIKGINHEKNNLPIICRDISMAAEYAHIDDRAYRIIKEYTPGPYTFLLRSGRNLPKAFKGRKTVGVRIPDNQTSLMTADALGNPLLATSIQFDNADEAREPELMAERYASLNVGLIADAEPGGQEYSTIIDLTDSAAPQLMRQGKGEFHLAD